MRFNDETNEYIPPSIRAPGHLSGKGPAGGKTALVLAGGGITGAVYEIGALRAMNDMLVNRTVNDFDIYVGTSAGALVGAMIANHMTPDEMMQAIGDSHPEVRGIRANDIFQANVGEGLRRVSALPITLLRSLRSYAAHFNDMNLTDLLWDLTDLLPSGLYNSAALERYLGEVLARPGCVNRFDLMDKDLYIVATDLDTGERAVFGKGGQGVVPVNKAVAASSAVPLLYKPVQIYGKEYIDGGIRGNASIDLAIEAGARLVVCINPLTPINAPDIYGEGNHLSRGGMRAISRQVLRVLLHSGLRYHIKNLRHKYPDVDIILIEPRPDDQKMFGYDLMDYASRLRVINHGFESVTVGLCENFPYFQRVLARHGIDISPRLVQEELDDIRAHNYAPDALRRVFAQSEERRGTPDLLGVMDQLESSLHRLGAVLAR
ncbi:MAG: patatin-like phospholipase family protein [Caldilineaceae bacterium]|nr:patatin-like phospholipase family protein [Caldilineaceae bacterium]HRJ40702.1 patatin-like phospholipase family protein [Caldilineaceae bacterium]